MFIRKDENVVNSGCSASFLGVFPGTENAAEPVRTLMNRFVYVVRFFAIVESTLESYKQKFN